MLNSLLQKVEQMEPICPKQDGMVCRVCGQRKYLRKEWFNPQWQECSPVVMGHQGGDFDRCKTCYYNIGEHAPVSMQRGRDDTTAIILAKEIKRLGRPLAMLEMFIARWMEHPTLVKTFHPSGAVEVVCVTDPKQTKTRDGRWTFDPENKVYEKCFWLLWPNLVGTRERVNLGNVIESVLGVREQAVAQQHFLQEDDVVISVATHLSEFVNLTNQFIMYTESKEDLVSEWVEFVRRLQASVVAETRLNEED